MSRRDAWGAGALLAAVALVAFVPTSGASDNRVAYPRSMAALGDSLTLAYATPGGAVNSWSTGTSPSVQSHYKRILAAFGAIEGKAFNLAVPGASFAQMRGQARRAIAKHVDYVTVWGGEEWCGVDDLGPLERDFDRLLRVLMGGATQPRV